MFDRRSQNISLTVVQAIAALDRHDRSRHRDVALDRDLLRTGPRDSRPIGCAGAAYLDLLTTCDQRRRAKFGEILANAPVLFVHCLLNIGVRHRFPPAARVAGPFDRVVDQG